MFEPSSAKPFKLSRSKVELFLQCPRCFYVDRRMGIGRVDGPGYSLNLTVDLLLKKEFDIARTSGDAHPLMKTFGIDAVPYLHPDLEMWRDNRTGIKYTHEP